MLLKCVMGSQVCGTEIYDHKDDIPSCIQFTELSHFEQASGHFLKGHILTMTNLQHVTAWDEKEG